MHNTPKQHSLTNTILSVLEIHVCGDYVLLFNLSWYLYRQSPVKSPDIKTNLVEQFNEVAFTFNGAIACMCFDLLS